MVLEYLPAFTPKTTQMSVNIPYMEHLGMKVFAMVRIPRQWRIPAELLEMGPNLTTKLINA